MWVRVPPSAPDNTERHNVILKRTRQHDSASVVPNCLGLYPKTRTLEEVGLTNGKNEKPCPSGLLLDTISLPPQGSIPHGQRAEHFH
jgi:hypothetical protein